MSWHHKNPLHHSDRIFYPPCTNINEQTSKGEFLLKHIVIPVSQKLSKVNFQPTYYHILLKLLITREKKVQYFFSGLFLGRMVVYFY